MTEQNAVMIGMLLLGMVCGAFGMFFFLASIGKKKREATQRQIDEMPGWILGGQDLLPLEFDPGSGTPNPQEVFYTIDGEQYVALRVYAWDGPPEQREGKAIRRTNFIVNACNMFAKDGLLEVKQ